MYPDFVIVMTICWSAMRSSVSGSSSDGAISVRRGSLNRSEISSSSSLISARTLDSSPSSSRSSRMRSLTSAGSCLIASLSRPLRLRRRLDLRQRELGDQLLARCLAVGGLADDVDDGVQVVERDEQALEDVRAR